MLLNNLIRRASLASNSSLTRMLILRVHVQMKAYERVPPEQIAIPKTAGLRGNCRGFLAWDRRD